jgi:hypothetical protein
MDLDKQFLKKWQKRFYLYYLYHNLILFFSTLVAR